MANSHRKDDHRLPVQEITKKIRTMATYTIKATITVSGVRSRSDAVNELQVMLDDYHDNNPGRKEITIGLDKVNKENGRGE